MSIQEACHATLSHAHIQVIFMFVEHTQGGPERGSPALHMPWTSHATVGWCGGLVGGKPHQPTPHAIWCGGLVGVGRVSETLCSKCKLSKHMQFLEMHTGSETKPPHPCSGPTTISLQYMCECSHEQDSPFRVPPEASPFRVPPLMVLPMEPLSGPHRAYGAPFGSPQVHVS
jgi:hypothetical protein